MKKITPEALRKINASIYVVLEAKHQLDLATLAHQKAVRDALTEIGESPLRELAKDGSGNLVPLEEEK